MFIERPSAGGRLDWAIHSGEYDRATIGIGEDDEASPGRVLSRPEHRETDLLRLSLALVGVIDEKPHGSSTDTFAGREDSALVVTSVVAVEDDPTGWATNNDDDVVLEDHWQLQGVHIEGPRRLEVGNEQNEALEAVRVHVRGELPRSQGAHAHLPFTSATAPAKVAAVSPCRAAQVVVEGDSERRCGVLSGLSVGRDITESSTAERDIGWARSVPIVGGPTGLISR